VIPPVRRCNVIIRLASRKPCNLQLFESGLVSVTRGALIFIFLFLVTPIVAGGAHAADSAPEKVQAWEFEQTITNWGVHNIILTRDAAKIVDRSRGYTLVCKAPDWNVTYFSASRKKIASTPLAKFDGGLARRLAVVMATFSGCENPARVTGWIKNGTQKYSGQLCQKWIIREDIARQRELLRWAMLTSKEIKISPQVSSLLSKQICMPDFGSPCLFFQNGNSIARPVVSTTKMRKTLVSKTIFDPPKGFENSTPEKVMFTNQDFEL
jgi:hypothetical protein